jgi:hypothetical protein
MTPTITTNNTKGKNMSPSFGEWVEMGILKIQLKQAGYPTGTAKQALKIAQQMKNG